MTTLSAFTIVFWFAYLLVHGQRPWIFYWMNRPVKGSHQSYVYYTVKKIIRVLAGIHLMFLLLDAIIPHARIGALIWVFIDFALYYWLIVTDPPDDDNWFSKMKRGIVNFVKNLSLTRTIKTATV